MDVGCRGCSCLRGGCAGKPGCQLGLVSRLERVGERLGLQREAGQTRAGYHPGGRWEDAREWVIASFRQHTSRDGDPQLHVHSLILHKVRRESDGWPEQARREHSAVLQQAEAKIAPNARVLTSYKETRTGVLP